MPLCRLGLVLLVVVVVQVCPLSALPAGASGSTSARADRDNDGLSNRFEQRRSRTSPRRRDTDRDRLSDGYEVRRSHTNPRRRDTDRDGLSDGREVRLASSPLDSADPARTTSRSRDVTPPDTALSSAPSGTVASSSASFSFSGSDNVTRANRLRFECRLDGGAWGDCVSPNAYSGLADGPHTFDVRAKDAAGNVDPSPASGSWTIDALDALFSYAPGAPFTGQQVTFDATASKCMTSPCQYQWVDEGSDGPGGTDWPLGSGKTLHYTFHEPGTKHARLTVTDARGASSSVEQDVVVTQSLDTIAPETSITASPPSSTTSASASFAFASTEPGSSFECQLDSGAWASCTSPTAYASLGSGPHTFRVRATDPAGNGDASPAAFTWTIQAADTTPPDTSISAGPSGTVASGSASFSFSSTESGTTFECRLDAGSWGACGSPKAYSSLADGSHTFEVRATDAAGNVDASPAARTWTIDTTPPATTITSGPSGTVTSGDASFGFSSPESGASFECRLDGGSWGVCTSPKVFSSLAVGSHTFEVRALDAVGNVDSTPASRSWTVVGSVAAAFSFSPGAPVTGQEVTFDAGGSVCGVAPCQYQWVDVGSDGPGGTDWPLGSGQVLRFTFQFVGVKNVQLTVTDAGGASDSIVREVAVVAAPPPSDTVAPETSITSGPSGSVASSDASFGFASSESGSSFECRLDAGAWAGCSSPKSYSGLAEDSHSFDVRARDAAGNVDASPASRAWTVVSGGGGGGGGCSQTLSPGANLAGAVAGAANGSTICLGNGDYGTVNLWNITRSGYVTLKSASGRGATLKPSVGNSDYIRLDNLTLHAGLVNSCSTNVQVVNSTFVADRAGMSFDGSACPGTVQNVVVDNVSFANVDLHNYEGRLNFRDVNGATVTNSFFGAGGYGDGIQTQGNTRNLTIGPGNTFDGVSQSVCDAGGGAHCDAIQLLGGGATAITGNYFRNGDTYIMAPDGSSGVTTTNNVFDGSGRSYEWKIQFGSAAGLVFRHNTVINASAAFDSKSGMPATSGAQVRDNVWAKGYGQIKTSGGNGCTGCSFSHNLFDKPTNAIGTTNIIGIPLFNGGTTPTSYTGWRLTTTSPGHNAASDGTNIGIP